MPAKLGEINSRYFYKPLTDVLLGYLVLVSFLKLS